MGKQIDELLKQVSPDVVALNPDLFGQPEPVIEEAPKPKRRTKYGNIHVELDGLHFDSKAEATRYRELRILEEAGQIRNLQHHPAPIVLVPAFTDSQGRKEPGYSYEPDFMYEEGNLIVVEDVKSVATAKNKEFRNKWQLLKYQYRNYHLYEFRLTYNKKQTRRALGTRRASQRNGMVGDE